MGIRGRFSLSVVALVVAVGLAAWATAPRTLWTPPVGEALTSVDVDAASLAEALSSYVQIDTSNPPGRTAWAQVTREDGTERPAWIDWIVRRYAEPLDLRWQVVAGALVLFLPSEDARPPILWLDHVDVVPVADNERASWTHPPFAGEVHDGVLWGRGALDNKAALVAQLEGYAALRRAGVMPSRRVVIAICPDEETGGEVASVLAREHLEQLGSPAAVLDEGSYLLPDLIPGLTVAAVAVGEKQFATFRLTARGEAGHSSMPRPGSAIERLVAAVDRVQHWETPARVHPAMVETFRRLAPLQSFPKSVLMGHAGWFEPVLRGVLQRTPAGNAITRDTIVTTILDAGVKDNVVPAVAEATLNARLLPETEPAAFQASLEALVADLDVEVTADAWNTRAPVSSWDDPFFHALERAASRAVEGAVVAPIVTPGTMDARHFAAAGLPAYRFHPFLADKALRGGIHGVDERVPVTELARGARFYADLLQVQ